MRCPCGRFAVDACACCGVDLCGIHSGNQAAALCPACDPPHLAGEHT